MPEASQPIILVVDDDSLDREWLRTILERAGYQVVEARSGHEALETLKKTSVDLTILDLTMPDMDGLEVLRAAKHGPKSKIIVVTGLGYVFGNTMLEAARRLGAAATLDKKEADNRLVAAVRKVLGDGN